MIKLFGHREMIPLIVIFAVGGLGLWVGANQGVTEVIDAIAVILFALALLLAVVSAVAYRSKFLARRRANMWLDDKSTQPSTLPGEKVSEMRVLMGEEAFKDALGVLSQEVSERHVTLHKVLAEGDYAKASAELHTLFGIYAGYGFEELKHLALALQDSCDAKLTPPAKSLQHFDELSSELLHKIKRYRAETMA